MPARRRWSAATRCPTFPASAATGSASSAKGPPAATCTSTSRSATCSTSPPRAAASSCATGTRPVVLISAGVGATPVLAMLHALVREHSTRPVWWLHGARNGAEHAFGAEFDGLLATLANAPPARRLQPARRRGAARTTTWPAGSTSRCSNAPASRPTPTTTSAGPTASCARSVPRSPLAASRPSASRTEVFGAVAVHASGIVKAGDRPPHAPDGPPGAGPTVTFAAQQPRGAVGRPLPQPARSRRGVRRPGRLRLPQRRLPQLRERPARRRGHLRPSTRSSRRPTGRVLVCCTRPASELTLDL